ncbi:MAG: helix-turn-helix domain-containing protein [Candidatus Omnitrophica bacterium]|nr:helix-turn-helix domain-containing protein [Candidatus Omnitrophota bacterium]MBU4479023.1 helix-turn-helix domain-containing protein [Candidatus Omnitrophota bacterium]
MKKIKLEKIDGHLQRELKNKKFRTTYEVEAAKVALAQKIAELRQENHLNQVELAKKLGVSQQFISQIETGQERNLTLDTLVRLATTLGRGVKISFPKASKRNALLQVI